MQEQSAGAAWHRSQSLSEFLSGLELRGQSWCFVEIATTGGFTIQANQDVVFYAVLEGKARIATTAGEVMEINRGEVAMILSGEAHAVRTYPDSPADILEFFRTERAVDIPPVIQIGEGALAARILCGRLKPSWPSGLRPLSMPPVVRFGDVASASVRCDALQLLSAGNGAAAVLTKQAMLMLTLALRSHPQCSLLFSLSATCDPIAKSLELIGLEPGAKWSIASLARKVGMGRSSFAAIFASKVGRTPNDVLTERRMLYAAQLLEQPKLKIAEISARAGYRSGAAFSRRFNKYFGVTPGQMRKSLQTSAWAQLSLSWQVQAAAERR